MARGSRTLTAIAGFAASQHTALAGKNAGSVDRNATESTLRGMSPTLWGHGSLLHLLKSACGEFQIMRNRPMKFPLTHGMIAVALIVCAAEPAYAYLDPGTGNIILQAVLATVAGALVSLKLYGQKILILFKRMCARNTTRSSASGPDGPNEKEN